MRYLDRTRVAFAHDKPPLNKRRKQIALLVGETRPVGDSRDRCVLLVELRECRHEGRGGEVKPALRRRSRRQGGIVIRGKTTQRALRPIFDQPAQATDTDIVVRSKRARRRELSPETLQAEREQRQRIFPRRILNHCGDQCWIDTDAITLSRLLDDPDELKRGYRAKVVYAPFQILKAIIVLQLGKRVGCA